MGNSFSLQREPDTAIKFFERALQISPTFAYAHTLSGHEYIANEDLDKAVACFRHAIRCNDRHYNAWHGLGTIYYRQERLDLAEYHFRKAISLCSSNSVLYCFLCMVLHAQNTAEKEEEAETILRTVIEKDPSNCQVSVRCSLCASSKSLDFLVQLISVPLFVFLVALSVGSYFAGPAKTGRSLRTVTNGSFISTKRSTCVYAYG